MGCVLMFALRCREHGMACVQSFPPALQNGCYGIMKCHASCCCSNVLGLEVIDMAVCGHGPHQTSDWALPNFERVNAGREKRVPLYGPYFGAVCTVFSLRGFKKRHPFFGTCRSELGFGGVRAADNAGKGSHLACWMFRRHERQSMATPSAIF